MEDTPSAEAEFTWIKDEWDTTRCSKSITVVDGGAGASFSSDSSRQTIVLGKQIVNKNLGDRFAWKIRVRTENPKRQNLGLIRVPDKQLDFENANMKLCVLKYLDDEDAYINGSGKKNPLLGGRCKGGEEYSILIDFVSSQIQMRKGDDGPLVTLFQGKEVANSSYSLIGILRQKGQGFDIVPPPPITPGQGAFPSKQVLSLIGLDQDKEFVKIFDQVTRQIHSTTGFEKRLALQCLLANENQFAALSDRIGEPQHGGLLKEQVVEQMFVLAQSPPQLQVRPPTQPECLRVIARRHDKLIRSLVSAISCFESSVSEIEKSSLSLCVHDAFMKLPLRPGEPGPADLKAHVQYQGYQIAKRTRDIPPAMFRTLSGAHACQESYSKLDKNLVLALKEAKALNESLEDDWEVTQEFQSNIAGLLDDF